MSIFNYTISSSWNPQSENSFTKIAATANGEKVIPVSITGYWIEPKQSAYQAKTNLNATSFRFTCNAYTDLAGALYLKDLSKTEPQSAFSLTFYSNKDSDGNIAPYNTAFSNYELGYIQWSSSVDDVFYRTGTIEAGSISARSSTRYPIDTCELNIDVPCMPVFTDEESMNLYLSDPNNVEYQKLASNYLPPPKESVSSEMLIEEHQLLARRRMLMAKKNLLNKVCTHAFEIGDRIYYYGEKTKTILSSGEVINLKLICDKFATQDTYRVCIYIKDWENAPNGKVFQVYNNMISGHYYENNVLKSDNWGLIGFAPNEYAVELLNSKVSYNSTKFETNIPIFANKTDADTYYNTGTGIENAINYRKMYSNGTWVSV